MRLMLLAGAISGCKFRCLGIILAEIKRIDLKIRKTVTFGCTKANKKVPIEELHIL